MPERPLIVFDVNETLLDLQHVAPIFGRLGPACAGESGGRGVNAEAFAP